MESCAIIFNMVTDVYWRAGYRTAMKEIKNWLEKQQRVIIYHNLTTSRILDLLDNKLKDMEVQLKEESR